VRNVLVMAMRDREEGRDDWTCDLNVLASLQVEGVHSKEANNERVT